MVFPSFEKRLVKAVLGNEMLAWESDPAMLMCTHSTAACGRFLPRGLCYVFREFECSLTYVWTEAV